ncbi:MAG: Holliday junction resolvase RuvX [Patescibacteria group bacterium UBA2163]
MFEHDIQTPKGMKLLGIDYGTKRVGVAVSDARGTMAFPKTVLSNTSSLVDEVLALIEAEEVEGVVIGESKKLTGEENELMDAIRAFAASLQKKAAIPVFFEPEFYTSHEARRLASEGVRGKGDGVVDAHAAAIILNSYLNRSDI